MNSPERGDKSLRVWANFAKAINFIKDLDNEISIEYRELHQDNIFIQLNRLGHRQFPWQRRPAMHALLRYFKIFKTPEIEQILFDVTELKLEELYAIGLALTGHAMQHLAFKIDCFIDVPGINNDCFNRFVQHFSVDLPTMRASLLAEQVYDNSYLYTFNPMVEFPLIRIPIDNIPMLIAPIPTLFVNKFTSGIYYKLRGIRTFDQHFGVAYQKYVGEVISACNTNKSYQAYAEVEYHVGSDRKDSVDWILSDNSGVIFIECKTKRLRFDAKVDLASTRALESELKKMGEILFQLYKTLVDGLGGHYPHWKPTELPVYPLVVTLEDWQLFGEIVYKPIDDELRSLLSNHNIDPVIIENHPYTICSVDDLEIASQIIAQIGVAALMGKKTDKKLLRSNFRGVLLFEFQQYLAACKRELFPGTEKQIHPAIKSLPDE